MHGNEWTRIAYAPRGTHVITRRTTHDHGSHNVIDIMVKRTRRLLIRISTPDTNAAHVYTALQEAADIANANGWTMA